MRPVDSMTRRRRAYGLRPSFLRFEDVGALEEDGVDGLDIDELDDVEGMLGGHGEVVEVGLLEDDVLVLAVLVALDEVFHADLGVVVGRPALHADAGMGVLVEVDEADIAMLGRGVELHGDDHHAEADGALPDGA